MVQTPNKLFTSFTQTPLNRNKPVQANLNFSNLPTNNNPPQKEVEKQQEIKKSLKKAKFYDRIASFSSAGLFMGFMFLPFFDHYFKRCEQIYNFVNKNNRVAASILLLIASIFPLSSYLGYKQQQKADDLQYKNTYVKINSSLVKDQKYIETLKETSKCLTKAKFYERNIYYYMNLLIGTILFCPNKRYEQIFDKLSKLSRNNSICKDILAFSFILLYPVISIFAGLKEEHKARDIASKYLDTKQK